MPNDLSIDVSADLRLDIAKRKAEIQHAAREEALYDAIEGGHVASDPYSPYATPTEYAAPCGCVARQQRQCDGYSVWSEWVWSNDECARESMGE